MSALHQRLAHVGDAERGLVGGGDVVVDDGSEIEVDVILCHAYLSRDLDDLDLDVDGAEVLAERVHVDETWVDGAFEATEFGNQTDFALVDGLEGVGAADTAGNGTQETDYATQAVDCLFLD